VTPAVRDRRRAQAGTTLVELLVAVTIAGLSLALIIGTLSTGLLDATLAKRNAAVQAAMQYETEQVGANAFSASAPAYSECFATENPTSTPALTSVYQGACPNNTYSLRADVSWSWKTGSTTVQVWTIAVVGSWATSPQTISTVQLYKVAHQ
jgi:type II secretory pathway pseudopilin PulG